MMTISLGIRLIVTMLKYLIWIHYMAQNKLAELFSFKAYLNQDGKVDIRMESVNPEELIRVMERGLPDYEGTFKLASLVRYLKTTGDEMLNKSTIYTH